MSAPTRRLAGPALVAGIVLLIALIAAGAWWRHRPSADEEERFGALLASGRTHFDQDDPDRAIAAFQQARAMNPNNPDVHLNLANAFLRANQPVPAASHAAEAVHLEPGGAAGHYLLGCALLRQGQWTNALQSLQQAKDIDRTINAVSYQMGRAYAGLGLFEEAVLEFSEVTQFETNHPSAHYQLSQALLRLGRRDEAAVALAAHQAVNAGRSQAADNPSVYERCVYTAIRAPSALEQPDRDGIPVRFTDQTVAAFGPDAPPWRGPVGVLDLNRRGMNDLAVLDADGALRLLWNSNGVFQARGNPLPVPRKATRLLVADLNNDRFDDLLLAGPDGVQVVRMATNGMLTDVTRLSLIGDQRLPEVALGDFDFTGKLNLFAAGPDGAPRVFRGLGTFTFRETTATSGIPAGITGVTGVTVDDWNNDDLPDVLLTRTGSPPLVLSNQRGGGFSATNQPADWPAALALATGDFNNDLRTDAALLTARTIDLHYGGLREPRRIPARDHGLHHLQAIDYDNDGWPDLVGWGDGGLRMWRNRGRLGFADRSESLALPTGTRVTGLVAADFDQDGDPDLVVVTPDGLRFLRNDGGNANGMVRIRLLGNRSNASGLGVKVEAAAGAWRTLRSVQRLPVEIGTGRHRRLDNLTVRWFDTQLGSADVEVDPSVVLNLIELTIPQGSCPYLYAWNGTSNRFVTDLLGASPAGLPVAPGRYIEADPEELVRIGTATDLPAVDGRLRLQVTEELCEILYLDAAQLLVVDRPAHLEVQPTSRLLPGRPYPPHRLLAVANARPPRSAVTLDGADVTASLSAADGLRVSPPALRGPHYRGLAEPHGMVLEFDRLDPGRPQALVLEGWLRFGGGMANIAASLREEFPFPFPVLEAGNDAGNWSPVDIAFGATAGKTKSYVVDLTGRLPAGTVRLRLAQSFEIHWDRIALGDLVPGTPATADPRLAALPGPVRVRTLDAAHTDLHARGYSRFAPLPWTEPQTPVYDDLLPRPNWHRTPSGWATRYGPVGELLAARDEGLVIVAGGDELTLEFAVGDLPEPPEGHVREYFLWTVGWDKDADFHVAAGLTVGPLPWTGMDDQQYGRQVRPAFPSDVLHGRYNTRWVGPHTYARRPR